MLLRSLLPLLSLTYCNMGEIAAFLKPLGLERYSGMFEEYAAQRTTSRADRGLCPRVCAMCGWSWLRHAHA